MKRMLTVLGVVFCFSIHVFGAAYSGGSGEPNNPYRISNIADWQTFMTTPDDWDKNFILTADIDLAGVTVTPIGGFKGVFDGQGHVIRNISSINYGGLFGSLQSQISGEVGGPPDIIARICNLGVED